MKKLVFFMLLASLPILSEAQSLKVRSDGNVVAFSPGFTEEVTDNATKMSIKSSRELGLRVLRTGSLYSTWGYALWSSNPVVGGVFNVGTYGGTNGSATMSSGRAFGVLGAASNSTSGYNYGVFGVIYGAQYGAAVYGALDNTGGYVNGRYAGYFAGDVRVTGTVNGVTITTASDLRYKQNVATLTDKTGTSTLRNILSLNPVEYNLRQVYIKTPSSDTATVETKLFDENSQQFKQKHYGLIAQELQKIYPNLVNEDSNGYLSVNYIEIIPLLIESVKELKTEIDQLKIEKIELRNTTGVTDIEDGVAALFQNTPNPFFQETVIRYYLPQSVKTAYLCVYDLQGKQLKQYPITERGEGIQHISGSEFAPGIYLYALIADSLEVDVKRMILTE